MATGGIFTIITNDGKQDRMLMATALLHDRLRQIRQLKSGDEPTLLDIEKTHVLFTNAHFKPFAAIGFEYNRVRPSAGSVKLGSRVQFSIPQFGDFFHDIACHVVLSQPTITNTAVADSDKPLMRWCNFPGERLLAKVQQEVNGNPLDEYTYHATNMHREFRVAPNKLLSWNRCVGQEVAERGWVKQPNGVASGVAPADVSHRVQANVDNGNQTPTGQKVSDLELFIPLLFWYNKDVRLAVPSVAIPYGQRFINLDLASPDDLVGLYPRGAGTWAAAGGSLSEPDVKTIELYINNIFVNPEIHKIYIKRIGFSLIRVHRQQLYHAVKASDEVLLSQMKWPIEYLYVGMKMRDYHASSSQAAKWEHLDKWQTFNEVSNVSYNTNENAASNAVFTDADGVATLGVAAPVAGVSALTGTATCKVDVNVGDTLLVNGAYYVVETGAAAGVVVTAVNVYAAAAVVASAAISDAALLVVAARNLSVEAQRCTPTMSSLSVKAHGITLYDDFQSKFFNAYTTYHFGGPNINAPEDCGLLFVPFCLYPGTYQPSGHINVSRAREFYINYHSDVVGAGGKEGTLVVIASAINFLLISDGSAVLRYST